jgi:hypothetical protein
VVANIVGPTGPTGPTGSAGATGPTGPTGPAGAGATKSISIVTTTVTLGSAAGTEYIALISTGGNVTLPTAVSNTNRYTIKNITSTDKTIGTTSSQTIDGSTVTLGQNSSVDLASDGSNWYII